MRWKENQVSTLVPRVGELKQSSTLVRRFGGPTQHHQVKGSTTPMLAFGYARWKSDSGTATTTDSHFVIHRGQQRLARVQSLQGVCEEFPPAADVESIFDAALQLASDVEDARDAVGAPHELPLRCLVLPENTRPDHVVPAFLAGYFRGDDSHDVNDFLTQLLDAPQLAPTGEDLDCVESALSELTVPTKYTTPSGGRYIARTVGGLDDVPTVQRAIARGWTVGFCGEPGSGKTTLAQVAAPNLVQHAFHGETTVEDVIGRFVPDPAAPSGFSWKDGPLLISIREKRPFLADELPRAPREVQALFLSVCDHRRAYIDLANPHIGELVAGDGFAVLITYNPGSGFGMDDALVDRIAFTITVPTDLDTAAELEVPLQLVSAARALQQKSKVAAAHGSEGVWVPSLRSLLKARDVATEFGLRFAAAALISACPDELLRPDISRALEKELKLGKGTLKPLTTGT